MQRLCALALLAVMASAVAPALAGESSAPQADAMQAADSAPPYRPQEQVTGTIRLWGHGSPKHDFMGKLVRRWAREFHGYQPHVTIVNDMYGTASAVGALYTGAGDLAILGEEISPAAENAFRRERHYRPTIFEVATGSVDVNYFDYAQMVFVNRANPLDRLTLRQLARILGDPPPGEGSGPVRTWGQLGLQAEWADRKIQPYSWTFGEDFALFLQARVLGDSVPWNPQVRQFVTYDRPDGAIVDRGQQILAALARDPDGIAVSNIRFANPSVKIVKLAATSSGPYLLPTVQMLISQQYPLTRIIPAIADVAPGQPVKPAIREFLRFILSRQGQRALIEESGYLPLGEKYRREQLHELDELGRCGAAEACRPPPRRGSSTALQAQELASGPGRPIPGVIRVWGHPRFQPLARQWAERFSASHPQDRVRIHMTGSDTGMAGLFTGEADIALLGRAATVSELQAFEWVFRHPPTCTAISADGALVYVYRNSGEGTQALAPDFIHYILGQSRKGARSCDPKRRVPQNEVFAPIDPSGGSASMLRAQP
jgi:phosphate transport system substrate-binding protein